MTTSSINTVILSIPDSDLIVGATYFVSATVLCQPASPRDYDMYLRHGTASMVENIKTMVTNEAWATNQLQTVITYASGGINLTGNSNSGNISSAGTTLIAHRIR